MVAVFRQRIERQKQGNENDAANEHVKEDGEWTRLDGAEEAGSSGQRELPKAGPQGKGGSERGNPAQRTARPVGWKDRFKKHHSYARERKHDFRKDAVYVGHGIHCCTSAWDGIA